MWKKRIFFTRTTSEISFSNAEKRGHRVFSIGTEPTWSFCVSRKGVSSWKKRYSRRLRIRRKDIEWSNWPNSTTSRFTQVFDHGTFHVTQFFHLPSFPPPLFFFLFKHIHSLRYRETCSPKLARFANRYSESRTCDFEHANLSTSSRINNFLRLKFF